MTETWKDIPEYEGLYQVSDQGRIKSLRNDLILSPFDNGHGYQAICLRKNGNRKSRYVHRLVADAFIEREKPDQVYVNHLDYDTKNNAVGNLEWCTQKENVLYSLHRMRHPKSVTHSNTGERYISYRKKSDRYRVCYGGREYGSYRTLDDAIAVRDQVIKGVI